jgi:hypothetical protein
MGQFQNIYICVQFTGVQQKIKLFAKKRFLVKEITTKTGSDNLLLKSPLWKKANWSLLELA